MTESKTMSKKIGYLGPRGTFSEEIALSFYRGVEGCFTPYHSISSVIMAVDSGEVQEGIVPVENSVEGSVNVTLDTLAHEANLYIVKEMVKPIRHNIIVKPGTKHINIICSHAQALAQCRHYLDEHYPAAERIEVESTAAAAYKVASGAKNHAAICSTRSAEVYGLDVIETDIQDNPNNATRFLVLSKQPVSPKGVSSKTSIVCQINGEKAGALYNILGEFAKRNVNLTKIESRPSKGGFGLYVFFFDIEGSLEDEPVAAAVHAVKEQSLWFKNLGSYPINTVE
ncbi:MAG: pheA [Firmicutes bacterium]|nr:pheA [Bacillota bacterium]